MKKALIFLVLAAMLAAQLVSCSGQGTGSSVQQTDAANPKADAETEPEVTTAPPVPDTDWGGRTFRVQGYRNTVSPQFSNFEIDAESEDGEVVNDAIYRRNRAIEEAYNVTITELIEENDQIGTVTTEVIKKNVSAGEDFCDLAFCTIVALGPLARGGFLSDISHLEYVDFSQPWWNPEVNDTLSLLGKLYFTSSDFSLRDKNRTHILIYNRGMASDFSLGDAVALVDSGAWTYDVMTKWAKAVASDLNGNGTTDAEDRYGIGVDSYNSFPSFVASCNIVSLKKDAQGELYIDACSEYSVNAIEKIMALTSDPAVATFCQDWQGKVDYDYWSVSSTFFREGRSLFMTAFPHSLQNLSSKSEVDYGVLPYPKYDESQQNYKTLANDFSMLFCLPVSCQDPSFTGFMIEALSAASDTTLNAYYEISCKTKYTYDEDSARMLDLIFGGIIFEPAIIYGVSGLKDVFKTVGRARTNNLATVYASIESMANKDLENLIGDIAALD